ncbi:MAG: hypothetical protein ACR2RV_22135, partial [Verrucomicrobiales bacterium]
MRDYFKEGGIMRSSVPIEQFPLPHRGMIWLGLGMIILWGAFEIAIPGSNPLANPIAYPLAQDAEFLSGALLLFGIVFSVFGFGCELVLGVFGWQRSFAHERSRLEELSG